LPARLPFPRREQPPGRQNPSKSNVEASTEAGPVSRNRGGRASCGFYSRLSFAEYSETNQHLHGLLQQDARVNNKMHMRLLKRASGTARSYCRSNWRRDGAPGQHV